ncbi:hypothetical protein QZM97_02710 [Burkholderia orbicola]|uniref:hypothetical protein n=1 Tax=Burkholderia orbicola TaxID=2978683 RepID=UPI0026539A1C|nr:hypothetical protein [Burkholderia orbicola]MDN7988981.1 hypothetical protein [Burkholderia orbicola]
MIDQDKMRALAAMLRKYRGHGFVVDDAQDAADAIDLLLAEVEQNRIDQLEAHGEFELMTLANKRLSEDFALADSTIESKNRNIEEIVAHNNQLRAELEAAARERDTLRSALQVLHDETADYVRINNLGDPYHNCSMQMARDALAQRQGE